MKRETVKALLANGVLQAYAEGKEIEVKTIDGWITVPSLLFEDRGCTLRIKPTPQFKVGDLVRTPAGRVTKILGQHPFGLVQVEGNTLEAYKPEHLTPVREVRLPLTFEQAIKLVAEKGFILNQGSLNVKVYGLECDRCYYLVEFTERQNCRSLNVMKDFTFPDGTPFANVTYEDIP